MGLELVVSFSSSCHVMLCCSSGGEGSVGESGVECRW